MEGIGAEVTQKIRAAIKAKLTELGAYVDDELPDYIMVMVANKKNRSQMTEDLALFLGSSTEKFTYWLHEVLTRLQSVTIEDQDISDITNVGTQNRDLVDKTTVGTVGMATILPLTAQQTMVNPITGINSDKELTNIIDIHDLKGIDSEEILAIKAEPETDDPLMEELIEEPNIMSVLNSTEFHSPLKKNIIKQQNIVAPVLRDTSLHSVKGISLRREMILPKGKQSIQSNFGVRTNSAKVQPIQQRAPSSAIATVMKRTSSFTEDEDDEYDPRHPAIGAVASTVRVTERRSSVPPAMQANKLLLLKAVEDANKSVIANQKITAKWCGLSPHKISEFYRPTPVKDLFKKHPRESLSKAVSPLSKPQDICETAGLTNVEVIEEEEEEEEEVEEEEEDMEKQHDLRTVVCKTEDNSNNQTLYTIHEAQHNTNDDSEPLQNEHRLSLPTNNETFTHSIGQRKRKSILPESPQKIKNESTSSSIQQRTLDGGQESNHSPRFVVTLDGVDPALFLKNKKSTSSKGSSRVILKEKEAPEEEEEEEEIKDVLLSDDHINDIEEELEIPEEPSSKKQRVNERCRYWPACKNGDICAYHHPTTPCKAFPKCKYKDKCFYIHPNCKFDALCTRKDCPYTHASKRALPIAPVIAAPPPPPIPKRIPCKFYPNCATYNCPYFHSKPCYYGSSCQLANCPFSHPALPSRHQLKWTSRASLSTKTTLPV